jgi:hypothetical protein
LNPTACYYLAFLAACLYDHRARTLLLADNLFSLHTPPINKQNIQDCIANLKAKGEKNAAIGHLALC